MLVAVDSSTTLKSPNKPVNYSKIPLYAVQLEPFDNSATFKMSNRQLSHIQYTLKTSVELFKPCKRHILDYKT